MSALRGCGTLSAMPSASSDQKARIDARRHAECGHPQAQSLATLEFLACKRCGVSFIEGRLEFTPVQLGHQDPPGETHLSSYMGDE